MKTLLIALCGALWQGVAGATLPIPPYEAPGPSGTASPIDRLVLQRLRGLGVEPAPLCSDPVFVRRAYLDTIGLLPTAQEARAFLLDRRPDKRRRLVDRLLSRSEFADYWMMKWCDLLRVKSEFPIRLWPNAVQAYAHWIHESLQQNVPYDRFARELLTSSGSNFRAPPVNFYRAVRDRSPEGLARAVALTFMGTRADKWPKERLDGMAAFFSKVAYKSTKEWKEEIVYFDPDKTNAVPAVFPDGSPAHIPEGQDPRKVFADWLIRPENPWFARNIANRVWSWLMGRGIIHEPDDIRPDNPPSNPELLAYLESELVRSGYDLRRLFRLILTSQTYQRSSVARDRSEQALANFAFYPMRRLEAETLIDVINQVTGGRESYVSQIPEPYTYIPEERRSVLLADGSITSSFLEMFGRPPRDTGLESERNNRITAEQRLHLLNSSHIRNKIEQGPRLRALYRARTGFRQKVAALYLTLLSRYPTADETAAVEAYSRSGGVNAGQAIIDTAWALINSSEFLYRH